MLLHLGKDSSISLNDVILIVDKKSAFESEDTRKFFELAKQEGIIKDTADEVKSYIVTEKTIYTSNISSVTLKERAGFMEGLINI